MAISSVMLWCGVAFAAPELQPTLTVDADVAVQPLEDTPVEFRIIRLYGGLKAKITDQLRAVAVVNAVGESGPKVVDGYIAYAPFENVEFSFGYAKTPLFALARDTATELHPLPEIPMVSRSFWPGRDVGLEAHVRGPKVPVEVRARVGNGSGNPLGKASSRPAADVRLDVTAGRQRFKADRSTPWGIRLGGGAHFGHATSRNGFQPVTGSSFVSWTPPLVEGDRWVAEGHAVVQLKSVELHLEGAYAKESRTVDGDADPETPNTPADAVSAWGIGGELGWMITGQQRGGGWPVAADDKVGVEVAVRAG